MFKFELDINAAAQNTVGGKGKVETGIYQITINHVSLSQDKSNNPRATISFRATKQMKPGGVEDVEKNGIIFDVPIAKTWTSGSDNFQYAAWQEFAVIAGMKTGALQEKNVAPEGKPVRMMPCFVEVENAEVVVAVNGHFDVYNGKETTRINLIQTYDVEGRTMSEMAQNMPAVTINEVLTKLKPVYTDTWKQWEAQGKPIDTTDIPNAIGTTGTPSVDPTVNPIMGQKLF